MKDYLYKLLIVLAGVLSPIAPAVFAIGVLIGIDLLMGIIAAHKQRIKFESKKLKNTAVKMLVYNLLLIAGFVSETYMVNWIPFVKIVLSFLAIVEITSIGENFQKITGLSFIKFLKDFINNKLNKKDGE